MSASAMSILVMIRAMSLPIRTGRRTLASRRNPSRHQRRSRSGDVGRSPGGGATMDAEVVFTPDDALRDRLLATLAQRPCGLFSDVDGTLSDIAPSPDAAALLPGVAELLAQARSEFALVVAVSG